MSSLHALGQNYSFIGRSKISEQPTYPQNMNLLAWKTRWYDVTVSNRSIFFGVIAILDLLYTVKGAIFLSFFLSSNNVHTSTPGTSLCSVRLWNSPVCSPLLIMHQLILGLLFWEDLIDLFSPLGHSVERQKWQNNSNYVLNSNCHLLALKCSAVMRWYTADQQTTKQPVFHPKTTNSC